MRIAIPKFGDKKALFAYLEENKDMLIKTKKSMPIESDVCNFSMSHVMPNGKLGGIGTKAEHPEDEEDEDERKEVRVKIVANTANWIDSHMDMLLPDSPKRSIKERKHLIHHLHDHVHEVEAKIGDVVDILLSDLSYAELGIKGTGSTQALIFITDVIKAYNEKVFLQYLRKKVNQHSIGLQYLQLTMAINDPDNKEAFAEWNKYIDQVINEEVAIELGFFFPVQEYRLLENSAVLFGSNEITPTLETDINKKDPQHSTPIIDRHIGIEEKNLAKAKFYRRFVTKK